MYPSGLERECIPVSCSFPAELLRSHAPGRQSRRQLALAGGGIEAITFDTSRKTCFGWSHSKSFQTVLNASMSAAFRVSALVTPDDSKVELVFTVQASGRGGIEARTIKVACERESMKSMTCFAVSV